MIWVPFHHMDPTAIPAISSRMHSIGFHYLCGLGFPTTFLEDFRPLSILLEFLGRKVHLNQLLLLQVYLRPLLLEFLGRKVHLNQLLLLPVYLRPLFLEFLGWKVRLYQVLFPPLLLEFLGREVHLYQVLVLPLLL